MADRPKGFGMTAELNKKKDGKYDQMLDVQVREWISSVTGVELDMNEITQESFHQTFKSGVILCKLINAIEADSVKKVNDSKMAFKQMENIGKFLDASYAYGVQKTDMFQTVDLYEGQNIPQVITGLIALSRKYQSKGGHGIGPKESTANRREFSEETQREGRNIIGLQMGSNKGASQAGMTPAGLQRQIEKTNLKI
ncbi:myophilin-like [Clavelina lepadiformis]|uniref:Transgelin n=1 Tax=Clavelina lepadiformis TaxID=159417 RepID=A0ABP0GVF6_CLALP